MTFVKPSRTLLTLLRLLILYFIFCYWLVIGGLALRDWRATRQMLATPAIATHPQAAAPLFLGITIQLAEQNSDQQRAALQPLHAAGFGWVRQRFDWAQIEPLPKAYDWVTADRLIDNIVNSNLVPVVVLDGSPDWARRQIDQSNPLAPPADLQTFATFAAVFASRYGNRVRFYQIWDEPNIAPHWGNRWIEPVEYAQLLIAASRAIRRADGDTVILAAALAPTADQGHLAIDEVYFLQRMLAAGASPWFDGVAIQPFGFGYAPNDSRQSIARLNFQRAALIRRAMIAAGIGDKALWAVRFGWNTRANSAWATVTAENQRRYAGDAIQLAHHDWPWLTALGWAIDQPDAAQNDPLWGFALDEELRLAIKGLAMGRWGDGEIRNNLPISPSPHRLILLFLSLPLILWRAIAAFRFAIYDLRFTNPHSAFRIPHLILWLTLLPIYHFATWPPLIGLCWLVAAGLIALRPQVGVWLAAATIPLYFQHKELTLVDQVLTIPPSLAATICLLPSVLRSAWCVVRKLLRPLHSAFDTLALLWLLINLLGAVNVWHWPAYRSGFVELVIQPLLLYGAIRLFVRTDSEQRQLVIALLAGGGLVAGWGMVDWLRGGGVEADGVRRLAGIYYSPNQAALYLLRTLLLTIGVAAVDRKHRLGWLALLVLIFVALWLTASRGALLLGLPVGLLAWGWVKGGQWIQRLLNRWRWEVIVLVLLAIGGLFLGRDRLLNSASLFDRLSIWQTALKLWRHFAWLGTGPGGFFWNYPAFLPQGALVESNPLHPHNLWLEFATNWGIVGLLWLGALLLVLGRTIRRDHWLSRALVCALLAALAHAQVDAFMTLPDLAAWNWVALGIYANLQSPNLSISNLITRLEIEKLGD